MLCHPDQKLVLQYVVQHGKIFPELLMKKLSLVGRELGTKSVVSLPILVIGVLNDLRQGSGPPLPISKMGIMWEKLFCPSGSQMALNSDCLY